MTDLPSSVLSCIEHERLAFELPGLRRSRQYLGRFRQSGGSSRRSGIYGSGRRWWMTNWSTVAGVENLF
jgi:hypothetical protein